MTLNLTFGSCSVAMKMLNSEIFVLTCSKASNCLICKCGLETLFKCYNKGIDKMSNCANLVLYFSKKVQHIPAFCFAFFVFSDQTFTWKWFWHPQSSEMSTLTAYLKM